MLGLPFEYSRKMPYPSVAVRKIDGIGFKFAEPEAVGCVSEQSNVVSLSIGMYGGGGGISSGKARGFR